MLAAQRKVLAQQLCVAESRLGRCPREAAVSTHLQLLEATGTENPVNLKPACFLSVKTKTPFKGWAGERKGAEVAMGELRTHVQLQSFPRLGCHEDHAELSFRFRRAAWRP